MFRKVLFEHIRDNFTVSGFTLGFGDGLITEDTQNPYIIMFELDDDGDPQFLCDDQFSSGNFFVQFNIYSQDVTNTAFIRHELDIFLSDIRLLTATPDSYIINSIRHSPSPSAQALDNGLGVDVLAKTINYSIK